MQRSRVVSSSITVDRPAAIRAALRTLVAERGFHGASMSAVAAQAGVAAGTAYVHYESKDDLVLATYVEIKAELGDAALVGYDADAVPADRYRHLVRGAYSHLAAEPERAKFLTQMEESPFYVAAHEQLLEQGDRLAEEAVRPDLFGCSGRSPSPGHLLDVARRRGPAHRSRRDAHERRA